MAIEMRLPGSRALRSRSSPEIRFTFMRRMNGEFVPGNHFLAGDGGTVSAFSKARGMVCAIPGTICEPVTPIHMSAV